MKLTVLSVAYPLAPVGPGTAGGAEQVLGWIDHALVTGGHRSVVIACEGSETAGELLPIAKREGELSDRVVKQARADVRDGIRRALGRWRFDVIHLHGLDFHHYLPPDGVAALATLHLPPDWYPTQVFGLERPNTWLHCVSQSQQAACPPSRLMLPYIANGVPVEELRTRVRRRCYALALGRICPEKGYHIAAEAARLAGVRLLVAGEVYRYQAHEEYFRQELMPRMNAGGHRFMGLVGVARKRRLLAGARCLLAPSLAAETSSLVAMEAMACGTPVIAFPSGALAEIVEHGRTGFLVKDVREMAEAIGAADSIDPEECRRVALSRFSAARMTQRYLALYEKLAWAAEVGGFAGA